MSARYANKPADRDRASECFGAPRHSNSKITRSLELGMVAPHRRRNDYLRSTFNVIGVVSVHDMNAEALEVLRCSRCGVTAGNRNSAANEQLGQRAHSRAGNAHEMHWTVSYRACVAHDFTMERIRCAI